MNIGEGGKGRLIMRHKGNMRLALNAALWPGMTISTMEGGRGITFSVVNVANEEGPEERKEAGVSHFSEGGFVGFFCRVPTKTVVSIPCVYHLSNCTAIV